MPGLNWCQLINFWCHLINIWGHVLLTIFQNTNTIASTNTNTHNLSMTLPAHSSIIQIQMQSCPHHPLQLKYRAREYRRMQGINYEALNALSPTRPQLSLFWQSPVCVVWTQFGCSCFACNRKTSLESQDTKYMKEWQKVVAEMYWMFMYKIYAKVAAMDVMRQGLRLYQHRAAPHPQLPLYLYRATHQYSQHTFFWQLLKKRESYFPYSYFLFVFRLKKK